MGSWRRPPGAFWRLGASPQRRGSPCRSFRSAGGKAQPYCRGGDAVAAEPQGDEPASDHGPQPDEVDDTDYLLDLMDMRDAPTNSVPAPAMPAASEVEAQSDTAATATIAGPIGDPDRTRTRLNSSH